MKGIQAIKGTEITPKATINSDLMSRFIAFLDVKPKSVETYTKALRPFIAYLSFNGIACPQREDIIAYRDELKREHRPTTVQTYITVVRIFFDWLEQEGLYKNVAKRIKGAKLSRDHKKDYLSSSQAKIILTQIDRSTITGARDYAILTLMITGGLRTIEVSRANIEDLQTIADTTVLYIQGKGRDERTDYVSISPQVEAAIRDYLKLRPASAYQMPLFASTSNNNKGQRLTTRSISGIVKQRLRASGYDSDRLTAHSLRHTAVTLSLLAGQPLEEVQQFARHSNISTTMIYNHAIDRAKNSCSSAVATAIF